MTVKIGDKRVSGVDFGVEGDHLVEVRYTKCVGEHSIGRFRIQLDPKIYWKAVENKRLLDVLP